MELSKTDFDIDLDQYDTEIPWLNRIPSAPYLSCVPSPNPIFKSVQADVQSTSNDSSHPLDKLRDICNNLTTHNRTHTIAKTKSNIIPIQEIHPTAFEIQQGYCQRQFGQTGKQRYICTICGKHYSLMDYLRIHQKVHTSLFKP